MWFFLAILLAIIVVIVLAYLVLKFVSSPDFSPPMTNEETQAAK